MKSKPVLLIFLVLALLSYMIIISSKDIAFIPLLKGKNQVYVNISEPIYVKTLIEINPKVEAISYKEGNETIGYVNLFYGIGKNFALESREYEIIVSEDINLAVPS
jgi:hypothetical protein